jgi:hypothetical protein
VDKTQLKLYLKIIYISIPAVLFLMLISAPKGGGDSRFGTFLYILLMALIAALCLVYMQAPGVERKRHKVQLISGRVTAVQHNPGARSVVVNGAGATGAWTGLMHLTINGQSMYFKTAYVGGALPPVQVGDTVAAAVIPNIKGPSQEAFEVLMLRDDTRNLFGKVPDANWSMISRTRMLTASFLAAVLCFTVIIPVAVVVVIRLAFLTKAAWLLALADAQRLIAAPTAQQTDNLVQRTDNLLA